MIKIDTGKLIMGLKGEPYKADGMDLTLGHVIAESLANDPTGGKMKMFSLAQKAYQSNGMEVDDADLALIKRSLTDSKIYNANNIILGQALAELEASKTV